MPRGGEPQDLANVILFLASVEASFANGAIVPVYGGWLAQG
jgi:NAD(P)-dependent dehydrogenase (short-subunit alcohol dehydrogenase family)